MLKGNPFKHGEAVPGLEEGFLDREEHGKRTKKQCFRRLLQWPEWQGKVSVVDGVEGAAEKTDPRQ